MTDHRNPPRSNWQEKNIKTSRDDFPFAIYTRKFNSSPLKVMMVLIKRSFPFPILLGFRPIFRGRLLLNFRGVCFTQRVCVLWFPSFNPKKNWPFTRCFRPEPPVHGHVVSAVTAASAAIVATLKAHPLQRTSFAARNCQVDGGICDFRPSFVLWRPCEINTTQHVISLKWSTFLSV